MPNRRRGWLGLGIVAIASAVGGAGWAWLSRDTDWSDRRSDRLEDLSENLGVRAPALATGQESANAADPVPEPEEIWQCEVVVVGGSLGGVAAAAEAMRGGARTCAIELTPWWGGQISSQGVSAIDESLVMRRLQNFSQRWNEFKQTIADRDIALPATIQNGRQVTVSSINGCWVGDLCFPPEAGHMAALSWLQAASQDSIDSQWATSTAFKGAQLNAAGDRIEAIYAVRRVPRSPDYLPSGRLSRELSAWYSWSDDDIFEKIPIRLEPVPGRPFVVIDATDTGELVGWANLPHRLGSESQSTTGEPHAVADNPDCTQAFTYPFALAIADDGGTSAATLSRLSTAYSKDEHRRGFSLSGFNPFSGRSFFHYRRIVSSKLGQRCQQTKPKTLLT